MPPTTAPETPITRPDAMVTAVTSVGNTATLIISPTAKSGLAIKNVHATWILWVRDPLEGEPANGAGYPILPGEELAMGDYRGALKAISPSGTMSIYIAYTKSTRFV